MDSRPDLSYRTGGPDDAALLAGVLLEAFATYREWTGEGWSPVPDLRQHEERLLAERLAWDGVWCLVAQAGERAIGYTAVMPARTREEPRRPIAGLAHLWHLWVVPDWWGTGVAPYLLGEAMNEAARLGYEQARLWTPRDNARARAFYRREGWRESGAEDYAPDIDLPIVEMRRPLGVMLDS